MEEKTNFLNEAKNYHSLGLNVIKINGIRNYSNINENNILKAPSHPIGELEYKRQMDSELLSMDWENATGVGVVLGYSNLMAIDIDGSNSLQLIQKICSYLKINIDYNWIIKTGSGQGFHILLRCEIDRDFVDDWQDEHDERVQSFENIPNFGAAETNAYYPKDFERTTFYKIEFKWKGNLVLPPSLHITGGNYGFLNKKPIIPPIEIDFHLLQKLREECCSYQATYSQTFDVPAYHCRAESDQKLYDFKHKRYEPFMLFEILCRKVEKKEENYSDARLNLISISWLVLDKHFNVVKRKDFNYFDTKSFVVESLKLIKLDMAEAITTKKREVYFEFLYDLQHCLSVFVRLKDSLDFLNEAINDSGLYLEKAEYEKVKYDNIIMTEKGKEIFNQMLYKDFKNDYNCGNLIYCLYKTGFDKRGLKDDYAEKKSFNLDDYL